MEDEDIISIWADRGGSAEGIGASGGWSRCVYRRNVGIEHEAMNRRRRKIGREDLDEVGEMGKERGSQDAESGKWFLVGSTE